MQAQLHEGVSSERVSELDGLRALAILLVLVQHYTVSTIVFAHASTEIYRVLDAIRPVTQTSWSGVDLFFVLSGFLIGGILLDNRRAPNAFAVFYTRRAFRILPVYLTMVALYIAINAAGLAYNTWLFAQQLPDWSYLTFTQNFLMAKLNWFGGAWLGATWSLAIEEQFYLIIPFVLLLLPRRLAIAAIVAVAIAAPISRALLGGIPAYVLPPARCGGLALGVLCAFLVRSDVWRAHALLWQRAVLVALPAFAALTIWAIIYWPSIGGIDVHLAYEFLYATILLAAMAWRGAAATSVLRSSFMRWIGGRSYALYLFHQPVLGTVHAVLVHRNGAPQLTTINELAATLLSLCLTLALVEISYRFLERPFLDLGARFKFQHAAAPGPAIGQPTTLGARRAGATGED